MTSSSKRDAGKRETISPRTAWAAQAVGVAIAIVVIVVELVANPDDFFWPVVAVIWTLYLVLTIALCLRPPGVHLLDDELLVRQFGRPLHIPRRHLQEALLVRSTRVIGGESSTTSRHLRLIVSLDGIERDIPAMWYDAFLGRLTAHEAEVAISKIRRWMEES
jgi:hypothetical protein